MKVKLNIQHMPTHFMWESKETEIDEEDYNAFVQNIVNVTNTEDSTLRFDSLFGGKVIIPPNITKQCVVTVHKVQNSPI